MMISRVLSLLVAVVYIVIALMAGAGWETLKLAAFLVLPLACIWFSEQMGGYAGMLMKGGPMTQTPGYMVAAGGWFLLVLPVIMGMVNYFSKGKT